MSNKADYAEAIWVPAHPSNFRQAGRMGYRRIIIHCTDGRSHAMPVARMWQEPHHGSSAHFVVDQDGTIIQAVRLTDVAYHAHQVNQDSVGVEHCCRTPRELGPGDPGLPPNATQMLSSARLVAWLCKQCDLPPTRATIKGHAECDPDTTHADCPEGSGLNVDLFVVLVAAEYAALPA